MGDTLTWNLVVKDGFSKGLKSFGDSLDNEGKRAHKFGEMAHKGFNIMAAGAVGGAAVAGAAIGKWVVDGVKGAASYNKVLAMTAQVLKSTGNVAGTSVKGVQDLAAQLETMSGVDEELIIHSQNVLATFTSIRNVGKDKIFDQATKSALDMSVALGSDLQGASIQVGKALNDPVKGVTALSKVGVSFTAKQKDTIKALVKTGDTLGAQKLILHELNKEFGGQAEAAGKGFEGAMARAQDAIADTGRSVGELLLPKVTAIADWLSDKIPAAVEDFQAGWSKMAGGDSDVAALATSLHGLANSLREINDQTAGADSNGFIVFAHKGIQALTTLSDGFQLLTVNFRMAKDKIHQYDLQIQRSWFQTIAKIADAGAKLPGPLGDHFRKIARSAHDSLSRVQGDFNKVNTKVSQDRIDQLDIKIRHLKGKTVKTDADRAALARSISQVQALITKNRNLHSKTVTVRTNYIQTHQDVYKSLLKQDKAMAGRRAAGGPVDEDSTYIVGENGPEIFTAPFSGSIIPTQRANLKLHKGGSRWDWRRNVKHHALPKFVKHKAAHGGGSPSGGSGGSDAAGGSGNIYVTINVRGSVIASRNELRRDVIDALNHSTKGGAKISKRVIER
jgi:hypothetical protein